ncbi:MDR family MFS transporter [Lachancea thermotolerans CBS 6340]|uniref:KLTH0B00594p n=1 Tax=Lachancea thermotolerans (strain ATCC 56472 / CBS 6340 / NRRL Y-8284) TaxID=559295 RepID=C5DC75_LACTC|nr:KLTH0B00594p [Lachancea thermotolerans CBS 6340]CAR21386.1 KLTH0B00594p [Lachancea thermotolerans CBS 6340]
MSVCLDNQTTASLSDREVVEGTKEDIHEKVTGGILEKADSANSGANSVAKDSENGQAAPSEPETAISPLTGLRFYVCFASLALSLFLAALDILIVGTIMETVAAKFNGYSMTGWLVTGYNLPNALLSLLWGRFGTVAGFKTSMLLSIVIFEVGSLIAAAATSMTMLIGGRVISGIGGSGIQTLCFVITSTLVTDRTRGTAISILSCAFAVASVAGPFLGGAFATHVTWRWCFYINLPIGGLAFFFFLFSYNPNGENTFENFKILLGRIKRISYSQLLTVSFYRRLFRTLVFKFDFFEFALSSAGFTLVLLALTFGGNRYDWNSGTIIAYFVVGILLIIASFVYDFVVFDRVKPQTDRIPYLPLLSWNVISKPGVLIPNIANFCTCFCYNMQVVYIVQYFQLVWGDSAWKASIHLIAPVISTVITVLFCGIITRKTGHVKILLVVGGIVIPVASGILTLLGPKSSSSAKIGLLILPGISFGSVMNGSLLSSQLQIQKNHPLFRFDFIAVTTFNAFVKMLGMAFGGIMSNMIFTTSVRNELSKIKPPLPHSQSVDGLISWWYKNYAGRDSAEVHVFMNGIKDVFWAALGLAAIAAVACFCSSNKKVDIEKPEGDEEKNGK